MLNVKETTLKNLREEILSQYLTLRTQTLSLCEPLSVEDYGVQTIPEVSPPKWHLAHTTWFFETFLLQEFLPKHKVHHPGYNYLFNSYYNTVGQQFPRNQRGLLSRPTVKEVMHYRIDVDEKIALLIEKAPEASWDQILFLLVIGMHHEQQHQELLLTDIKYNFAFNPLKPVYHEAPPANKNKTSLKWISHPGGEIELGAGGGSFCFDNERPRHKALLIPFELSSRPVTNREYLEFIEDQGYQRPGLWLSEGWDTVRRENWSAPLYWERHEKKWHIMTLSGFKSLNLNEPVCHVSYYEADAFARWKECRLPTEAEWESFAQSETVEGNFLDDKNYHPLSAKENGKRIKQIFGDVWEWTSSPYTSYPGYRPPEKALGEYNAKFMCNQMVLRGGSCATPRSHIRPTYRNFFHPHERWQFSGFRLARD